MLGDFAEKLRIPPAFVSRFINDPNEHMVLQGPDGQNFDVQLLHSINKLELRQGWEKFVIHHGLVMGDFLVFKYTSKSCFKENNQTKEDNDVEMDEANEDSDADEEEVMAVKDVVADEEDDSTNVQEIEREANDAEEGKVCTHYRIEWEGSRVFYLCEYGSCCEGRRHRFWELGRLNLHRALEHNLPHIPSRKHGRKTTGQQKHSPPWKMKETDVDYQLRLRVTLKKKVGLRRAAKMSDKNRKVFLRFFK
ncbi:hypothetical protein SUGI_0774510 [Cryptomeria japonica]|nr:hypothetical protein SUGI_0774510 [Cryptomeria japonica]